VSPWRKTKAQDMIDNWGSPKAPDPPPPAPPRNGRPQVAAAPKAAPKASIKAAARESGQAAAPTQRSNRLGSAPVAGQHWGQLAELQALGEQEHQPAPENQAKAAVKHAKPKKNKPPMSLILEDPALRASAQRMLSTPIGRVFVCRYGRFPEPALVVQEDGWSGAPIDMRIIREWDCNLRPGDQAPPEASREKPRRPSADHPQRFQASRSHAQPGKPEQVQPPAAPAAPTPHEAPQRFVDMEVVSEILEWVRQDTRVALLRFDVPEDQILTGRSDMRAQDTLITVMQLLRRERASSQGKRGEERGNEGET